MIDAADISLRHMRIDINHARQKTLASFACLLLALTEPWRHRCNPSSACRLARHFMTVSATNAKSDHLTSNPRPTAQEPVTPEAIG